MLLGAFLCNALIVCSALKIGIPSTKRAVILNSFQNLLEAGGRPKA